GANLASLLLQDYPGDFSVIVVDDHSSDATAAVARASGGGATPSRVTVLRALVSRARREGLLLSSLMAKLNAQSGAERAMIPAFVFFFRMLYPFAWVNSLQRTSAAAAGGCMLVDRNALHRAGGLAAIRGELIDDCALARLLKPHGPIRIA